MTEIADFIGRLGFPIAIAMILLYHELRCAQGQRDVLTTFKGEMHELRRAVEELTELVRSELLRAARDRDV